MPAVGMRRLLYSLSLCFAALLSVGCQSMAGPDGKITEATINQYLVAHEADIQRAADITTVAVLATVKDDAKRADLARKLTQIADSIATTIQNDNIDLSAVRVYAATLLTDQSVVNRDLAGLVIRSITDLIESRSQTYFSDLGDSSRKAAIRSLIRAGASGVRDATSSYTATLPPN